MQLNSSARFPANKVTKNSMKMTIARWNVVFEAISCCVDYSMPNPGLTQPRTPW